MTDWTKLLSEAEIPNAMREKKKDYEEKTIWRSSLLNEEGEGWSYYSDTKREDKVKVRKKKPADEVFENRLWVLLASMGFKRLNRDRHFAISYGDNSKQIDVFAADEETVLLVECKCAVSPKKETFKKELESISGYKKDLIPEIRKEFPDSNVKFIFATHNYAIGDQDRARMEQFGIAHFDDKTIKYYEELAKHLGSSARFQLLGSLFANSEIKGMDNRIPAIKGKMGGKEYYSFSIKPETLLKIGYVLHRSEANDDMLPTYQRIIKKSRLQSVHKFIENKGFFPNSLLISIDSKQKLRFDYADKQGSDDIAKLGILYLPNRYRSAYIIDGQHRLYGYSDSKYARTNSIPVVAFENLDKKEQVKLFMEINENQKAVSKNLRNTLNADLLWDSDNPSEKREALKSRISQKLGEDIISPLYNRVVIGEDQGDEVKCITLEVISQAIEKSNYLSKYAKDKSLITSGHFDYDNNDKTLNLIFTYLSGCFGYIKSLMPSEWEVNPKTEGILLINNSIGGQIRVFEDVANELIKKGFDPKKDIDEFLDETHYYLDPITTYVQNMTKEEKDELRKTYGGNGPIVFWRTLQKAIHEVRPEFTPEGYIKYWEDHGKAYNAESVQMINSVTHAVRKLIKNTIIENYPDEWINQIPKAIYTAASTKVSREEYDTKQKVDLWDCIDMDGLMKIVSYGDHWQNLFATQFTLPSQVKKTGGKATKLEWMLMINKLHKNCLKASFSVPKAEYELLLEISSVFVK